jgi:hypothetical protein
VIRERAIEAKIKRVREFSGFALPGLFLYGALVLVPIAWTVRARVHRPGPVRPADQVGLASMPVLLFFVALQKQFVAGLTAGSVK